MKEHSSRGAEIQLCPSCQAENPTLMPSMEQTPSFCLRCRFPLILVASKYKLLRVLGRGGFGTVYEAHHIHLTREEERVVKVLHPELLEDQALRRRFMQEIQVTCLLSQRNHHIVRIYDDFGEAPGLGFYYVMEFLKGHPLNQLMKQSQPWLPLPQVYHLFGQLCVALHAAHQEGIIHRDLKPANLYVVHHLDDPSFLKVLDFGIAKALQAHAETAQLTQGVLGTPAYMAPEQCMNEEVGPATDIYAMGIILFELLVGFLPFASADLPSRSAAELITAHLTRTPPRLHDVLPPEREVPQGLSQGLSDVLAKALAKDPQARFASALALQEAVQEVLGKPLSGASVGQGATLRNVQPEKSTRPLMAINALPTGQLDPYSETAVGLPVSGSIPSGDLQVGALAVPVRTDPELRPMATPYASIPAVEPGAMHTPPAQAGSLRNGTQEDRLVETQHVPMVPKSKSIFLQVGLVGVLLFLLVGLVVWLLKPPPVTKSAHLGGTQTAPQEHLLSGKRPPTLRRAAGRAMNQVPDQRPAAAAVDAASQPQDRPAARRIRATGPAVRRRRRRGWKERRTIARRKANRRRNVVRSQPPGRRPALGVAGCPLTTGIQAFVRFSNARAKDVRIGFKGGDGQYTRHRGGYCVTIPHKRVQLHLTSAGFRSYTPCLVRIRAAGKELRLRMFHNAPGTLEPEDENYCLR